MDESFLHRAEDLLFSELAAALELDREQVQPYIAARVEAARRSLPNSRVQIGGADGMSANSQPLWAGANSPGIFLVLPL